VIRRDGSSKGRALRPFFIGEAMSAAADEIELKRRFAEELLKAPDQPFKIGNVIFPNDCSRAIHAAQLWPHDPIVREFMDEMLEARGGPMSFLPSKDEFARAVYGIANDPAKETSHRLSAFRLYGEIRGFIEKPGTNVSVQNNISQHRVMLVQDYGTQEEWEQAATRQQTALLEQCNADEDDSTVH
jgi:hypothetical protein